MSDALSLTLPRGRARVRRRLRPPKWSLIEWALLFDAVIDATAAVAQFAGGHTRESAQSAVKAGLWWYAFHRFRARDYGRFVLAVMAVLALVVASGIADLVGLS